LEADTFFDSRVYKLLPLHSRVPYEEQLVIFDRPPPGMRKIILVRAVVMVPRGKTMLPAQAQPT
jgi:hypothetical protein